MLSHIWKNLTVLAYSTIAFVSPVLEFVGLNIFGACPIPSSTTCPSIPEPGWIYDFLPVSPIPTVPSLRYNNMWTFPSDYHLVYTYPCNTAFALTVDDKGCTKILEFDESTQTILCISGFAGTVTKEGTLIVHGIKCDPRGDFCIIIPFGWSLSGIDIGEELEVIRTTVFGSPTFEKENWQRDTSLERQIYRIVFDYSLGNEQTVRPKMMQVETTWDTDTLEPLVKTTWPDLHMHRYDMKCQAPYWYQATTEYEDAWKVSPSPVFDGVRRREIQTRMFLDFIDDLKVKYQTESATLDEFRNPELIP